MGVFSAVAGNQLPNQSQKRVLPALFHLRPLAITPTFSPWTHTSDDSYIYQLSLVLATATVSYDTSTRCTYSSLEPLVPCAAYIPGIWYGTCKHPTDYTNQRYGGLSRA